jgi:hypothetical protein
VSDFSLTGSCETICVESGVHGSHKISPTLKQYVDNVLEFDDVFFQLVGSSALRPQARLLMLIQKYGSVSVKEAIIDSRMSSRGFYMMMDGLLKEGILCAETDEKDKRVRRLSFCAHLREGSFISMTNSTEAAS